MVMTWIFLLMVLASILFSLFTGQGDLLAGAAMGGAQRGVELTISLAGGICLWSGLRKILDALGITRQISHFLAPVLHRLFPAARKDPALAGDLSANICANLLGLGNAATPMGLSAARRMAGKPEAADQLCRLVVLNTASIQLLPTTVAAVRASLGCTAPFDILPAVWITGFCSAALGLTAAWLLGKLWPHD